MTPEALLELFADGRGRGTRRRGHDRRASIGGRAPTVPGQYALDLVADAAALAVLERADVRIVSEESGVHEREGASITVVLDPVDGSTNCSRGISYWATSICALDADGPLAALVVNQATGDAHHGGPRRRRVPRTASPCAHRPSTGVEDAVVDLAGCAALDSAVEAVPRARLVALVLCDVAAGGLDGLIDVGSHMAPWDYLGG